MIGSLVGQYSPAATRLKHVALDLSALYSDPLCIPVSLMKAGLLTEACEEQVAATQSD
jgi:hypothetical protein